MVPAGDVQFGVLRDHDVYPGTEANQSEPLPGFKVIPLAGPADNSPRDQSRDLFDQNFCFPILNDYSVLFVIQGSLVVEGGQELARIILRLGDGSMDRHAVDMDIEDRKEDTDPGQRIPVKGVILGNDFDHLSVRRRNHRFGIGWDIPFRVPEKGSDEYEQASKNNR